MLEKQKELLVGTLVAIDADNIDTDQIISKEFLTGLTKSGLGENLFNHWRYSPEGVELDFVLNKGIAQGAKFLLVGDNFGCGSSREHAVWAVKEFGFDIILAESFADIFLSNCVQNNILAIVLSKVEAQSLKACLNTQSVIEGVSLDLHEKVLHCAERFCLDVSLTSEQCRQFINGYNYLDEALGVKSDVIEYERSRREKFPWL